jgi:hypothetical protein
VERALDPDLLARALGGRAPFPTGSELATLIATAELGLLAGGGDLSEELVQLAWYLHGVASVRVAPDLYDTEQQRAADRVAAHVFDLTLRAERTRDQPIADDTGWLRRCFAAQVSYVRSGLDPNALAVYRREQLWQRAKGALLGTGDAPALVAGTLLLGGDVGEILGYSRRVIDEAAALEERWGLMTLAPTPLGPPLLVVQAVRDIAVFLMYGRGERVGQARERLEALLGGDGVVLNRDARWVAALLLDLLDGIVGTAVRTVLPPDAPEEVRRAFTLATPPILTLWPPQLRLLAGDTGPSALDPEARRMLVSAPTSAGKTLTAQLLIASHLSAQQTGVCYVAPTRSLCREVERSLRARLRFLSLDVVSGLPEWGLPAGFETPAPRLEVMTPERLAYLLRAEGRGVLDRFGLFVFDEVHNIAGRSRGWTLESDLAFLHEATLQTEHRIVLVSAAVSNRAHFVQWMGGTEREPVDFHDEWRGPRRLHALWRTEADWDRKREYPKPRSNSPDRHLVPLAASLVARDPGTGATMALKWSEDVGQLVLRSSTKAKDVALSTAAYRTIVPVILHLAELGPVLVIESTRAQAQRTASAVAEAAPSGWTPATVLRDTALALLGPDHELTGVLGKGVAYHHGTLPLDIRTEIEDAVSAGAIRVLVSTTTLTEGVNLPVRSVVIASRGSYQAGGSFEEYIRGATLLNAIGRAGRAAKETEGYVVIAMGPGSVDDHFALFSPDDEELEVRSPLSTTEALAELAAFEAALQASIDAVYEARGATSDFVAFVWFVAAELERREAAVTSEVVMDTLRWSLGWVQMDEGGRDLWARVAERTVAAYTSAPADRRRRWAAAGMAVGSARTLEAVAEEVGAALPLDTEALTPEATLALVFGGGRLERLLSLPEAPKTSLLDALADASGQSGTAALLSVLGEWVRGLSLREIADQVLTEVTDGGRRLERLVEIASAYFERFLPWALSDVVGRANEVFERRAVEAGSTAWLGEDAALSDVVTAYVRWGVNRPVALQLTLRGVLSRRLAMAISDEWDGLPDGVANDVFEWLGDLNVPDWAALFGTAPAELRNLIDVVRPRESAFAAGLLRGSAVTLPFQTDEGGRGRTSAELRMEDDGGVAVIGVWSGSDRLGSVSGRHHGDVAGFVEGGLDLSVEAEVTGEGGHVTLRLVEP